MSDTVTPFAKIKEPDDGIERYLELVSDLLHRDAAEVMPEAPRVTNFRMLFMTVARMPAVPERDQAMLGALMLIKRAAAIDTNEDFSQLISLVLRVLNSACEKAERHLDGTEDDRWSEDFSDF